MSDDDTVFDIDKHRPRLVKYISKGHFRPTDPWVRKGSGEYALIEPPDIEQTLRICKFIHEDYSPDIDAFWPGGLGFNKEPCTYSGGSVCFGVNPLVFRDAKSGYYNILSKPEQVIARCYVSGGEVQFNPIATEVGSRLADGSGDLSTGENEFTTRFAGVSVYDALDGQPVLSEDGVYPGWREFVEGKLFFTESYASYAIAKAEQGEFHGRVGVLMCVAAVTGLADTPLVVSHNRGPDTRYQLKGGWFTEAELESKVICQIGAMCEGLPAQDKYQSALRAKELATIKTMFECLATITQRAGIERGQVSRSPSAEGLDESRMVSKLWGCFADGVPRGLAKLRARVTARSSAYAEFVMRSHGHSKREALFEKQAGRPNHQRAPAFEM